MTTACDLIRHQVLELPLEEVEVGDHVANCLECQRLIQTLKEELDVLDTALDGFIDADRFDVAFRAAQPVERPWARPLFIAAACTALAALFAWSVLPERVPTETEQAPSFDAEQIAPKPVPIPADPVPEAERTVTPDAVADDTPNSIRDQETLAILGKLTAADERSLLAFRDDEGAPLRARNSASRILMINAFAAGRTREWAALIDHHLNVIENGDPELHYKYALHLSKKGVRAAPAVIEHADLALDQRTVWTGSIYTSRVYSLYKIRAQAAAKIWRDSREPEARDRTGEYAREWLEYAKVTSKPTETAEELCIRTKGADYCNVE